MHRTYFVGLMYNFNPNMLKVRVKISPLRNQLFKTNTINLQISKRGFHNSNLLNKPEQEYKIKDIKISQSETSQDISFLKSLAQGFYSHTHSHQTNNIASHSHGHSHGHSHSHSHSNPMLVLDAEEIRKNAGVRVTWIGLGINVAIAVGKFIGGIVFHSQALFADSIHALSDMVSDFLTLFSVRLAANKPTVDYPFGYGKIETVGSLAVSTILMTAGISIGWSSLCTIVGPIIPHTIIETLVMFGSGSHDSVQSTVSDATAIQEVTNVNAAWIAALSIVAKEWIFRVTKKVAIETKSNVLMANAWHHRVDSLTSLVALVTISSGYLFNIQSLDTIGGLIVSGLIVKAGTEGMNTSIRELIDQSLEKDDEMYEEIEHTLIDSLHELAHSLNSSPLQLDELIVLASGPNLMAHAKIIVPSSKSHIFTISELSRVSNNIRSTLEKNVDNFKEIKIEYVEENNNPELKFTPYNANLVSVEHTTTHSHSHTTSTPHTHLH
ncbi:similar to Saccharomyces cerevisiae YPL224C MMT2 Putative metal transporter involved in mitochondrial iron accumulation [Maudiozyma saulgeensis]|uniref:Similar to Saccharomyces cerevisiae YPL224C MMT2 Putative metal transporter involved in mitochondrial iron accumulation n=1 Tax=Maudiozyma saulgeensis TaxID=1789683 RepID=A0A1X7R1B0_9SACH|nr:similar to Saccharomyces cerevisiae YPL224C MMT2 Putative metal transporter involved in mitochondrial iron accumulation [Kazachstania saulgeensis]